MTANEPSKPGVFTPTVRRMITEQHEDFMRKHPEVPEIKVPFPGREPTDEEVLAYQERHGI